jgi:hypothetical protein
MFGCNRFRFLAPVLTAAFALFFAAASFAADEPKADAKKGAAKPDLKVIKAEEAKDHEGEVVTVEFKVVGGREIDSGVCFLNSSTDRNDPKGFTAFITNKGLKKFKEDPKTEKPAELYKSKKVRVSGAIKKFRDRLEIEVNDPSQITIVEEKKEEKKS